MGQNETMTIGSLSKQSGIGIEAIRYYERIGLLSPLARKESGYRIFNNDGLKTLGFIKQAQELGFSLSEIRELLKLKNDEQSQCLNVQLKAQKHLQGVEEKMKQLLKIKSALNELIKKCQKRKTDNSCPILECFESPLLGKKVKMTKGGRRS